MVEVMQARDIQWRDRLTTSSPDEWLARDRDITSVVYLFVHPPVTGHSEPSRWSVGWPVGGTTLYEMTAWKFIQLEMLSDALGAERESYAYLNAITKSFVPSMLLSRRYSLGPLSLAQRQKIEELAYTIPVQTEVEGWSSQDWVTELLEKLTEQGVVSRAVCDDALSSACRSE